ncbi:unnamed protein product, partial [Iphiclides podalirius]
MTSFAACTRVILSVIRAVGGAMVQIKSNVGSERTRRCTYKMYTNPFERKHSALRQTLDRLIRGDARLSFRTKKSSLKNNSSNSSIVTYIHAVCTYKRSGWTGFNPLTSMSLNGVNILSSLVWLMEKIHASVYFLIWKPIKK